MQRVVSLLFRLDQSEQPEMILKSCQNFTGKSVAQQESPFYYQAGTILPFGEMCYLLVKCISL